MLNSADGKLYQSLVDNNTAPLSDSTKWFFFTDGKYLQLTGGELSGQLAIRNDLSSELTLEKQSGQKEGYTIATAGGDLTVYESWGGIVNGNPLLRYEKSNGGWDFNTAVLTKKTVPVATVQTEYWYIGGTREKPLHVNARDEVVFENKYGGQPVVFIPQIYIDKNQSLDGKARWVEINGRFDSASANDGLSFKTAEVVNDNGSISYEAGINASIDSIVAPNRQLSQIPGKWIKDNLASAPFRVKVIKLA